MATFKTLVNNFGDAMNVFDRSVIAFNKQDPDIGLLFDDKVVLVTVNTHTPYTGKTNVVNYLKNTEWPLKPQFTPTTIQVTESKTGTIALISGTAGWKDNDKGPDGSILYAFNLILKNGTWLISILWASADS